MTLAEISTKVMTKLEEEVGSSEWWTTTEIRQWINDLYRETAEELKVCKERDVSMVTVAEQMSYTLPVPTGYERILSLLGITYDKRQLSSTSVQVLDSTYFKWRNRGSGVPQEYFYDLGEEFTGVSLFPKPGTADMELGFDLILLPNEMGESDSPAEPFTSGFLLMNGTLAIALAKAGGGRDLDRSEHYWTQYIGGFAPFFKTKQPRKIRGFKSIEEVQMTRGVRLPDHYPEYHF